MHGDQARGLVRQGLEEGAARIVPLPLRVEDARLQAACAVALVFDLTEEITAARAGLASEHGIPQQKSMKRSSGSLERHARNVYKPRSGRALRDPYLTRLCVLSAGLFWHGPLCGGHQADRSAVQLSEAAGKETSAQWGRESRTAVKAGTCRPHSLKGRCFALKGHAKVIKLDCCTPFMSICLQKNESCKDCLASFEWAIMSLQPAFSSFW